MIEFCARGETDIISAFEAFVPGSSPGGRTNFVKSLGFHYNGERKLIAS